MNAGIDRSLTLDEMRSLVEIVGSFPADIAMNVSDEPNAILGFKNSAVASERLAVYDSDSLSAVGVAGQPVTLENINELRELKHFDLSSSSFNVLEDNTGVVLALIRGDDPDKATILSNSNIEIDELNDSGNSVVSDLNIADATALVNAGVAFTASGYDISDVATSIENSASGLTSATYGATILGGANTVNSTDTFITATISEAEALLLNYADLIGLTIRWQIYKLKWMGPQPLLVHRF